MTDTSMATTGGNGDELTTKFKRAVDSGDAAGLRALIESHPSLRERLDEPMFSFDAPAVVCRAWSNDRATIDVLLDAGADVNAKSRWWAGGFGVLHAAKGELAAHLIRRGARIDAHAAAHLGRLDELRRIVQSNPAAVHEKGGDGQRPLHFAANPEIAAFLLDHGAEIDARDVDHESTAAQWAVKDRPAVVRFLLSRGAAPDVFMLCAIGDAERVRAMLRADPSLVHARMDAARFPCPGSEGGHIYTYLIGTNATPLHAAAQYGQVEACRVLLEAGADPNATGGYDDSTPLHSAAWHNQSETAGVLLDHGADIDRPSGPRHRNTPLGWAIVSGSSGVVKLLLDRGASLKDWYLKDAEAGERGEFACFVHGRATGYPSIVAMLRDRGVGDAGNRA